MTVSITDLLQKAYEDKASDLHISVDSPPVFRIHGELIRYGDTPLTSEDAESMAKTLLGKERWEEFIDKKEYDFAYHLNDDMRFRVNAFHQRKNTSIAARVIPTKIPTIEQLNMPSILNGLAMKPNGLILVTGPTGSGKSTTLASMLDYINRNNKKHIITLEDPIEYYHEHRESVIQQREVGTDTLSFANGLRAALRQDLTLFLSVRCVT